MYIVLRLLRWILFATGGFGSIALVHAADEVLEGKWMLYLEQPGGELLGQLELVVTADGTTGYVEGGPIEVAIKGTSIELRVDSRDAGARRFDRILTGSITPGERVTMAGTYVSTAGDSANVPPRSWRAEPYEEPQNTAGLSPQPVSLAGIWTPAPSVDLRKYIMDTRDEAEAWTEGYDPNMDQPPLRCLSPGLVQLFGYPYPVEFVHAEDRIFMINEGYAQIRQIYLDGREPPDFYPNSRLGFSTGHWEGSTLVVRTTKIKSNIRDFRGEPFSDNAVVEEHYSLSDDGHLLNGVMVLTDPENFKRPAIRRVTRQRDEDTVILPYECDPDSFYRQLYEEERMAEYWQRQNKRL